MIYKALIKIGNNVELDKIIQNLLFEFGYIWYQGKKEYDKIGITTYQGNYSLYLRDYNIYYGRIYGSEGYVQKTFDAGTQLLELITYLKIPALVAPEVNVHKATYSKGDRVVKFGCAAIAVDMLMLLSRPESHSPIVGNRKIKSITLCSDVSLTIEQIKDITTYIHKVNNAS